MQRYFAKDKKEDVIILENTDYHHIKNVMRMKNGEKIISVYNKKTYICQIEDIENDIKVKVLEETKEENKNEKIVRLIVPFLKEQKMDLILQKSTELGVDEIILYEAKRSMVKPTEKIDKKMVRWSKILKEASEQSHRTTIPNIAYFNNINSLKELDGVKFVCSTREKEKNVKNILNSNKTCDKINIVVGPEGGLEEKEEEKLNDLGFKSISLGNRIMRVETVPLFVLSVINYQFME